MVSHREKFMDCQIEILANNSLTIDGKPIDVEVAESGQRWVSGYLPYSDYSSLLDLARAIVRDTEEFKKPVQTAGGQ